MKKAGLLLLLCISFLTSYSQTLEEELGFIYVKADYLLETNRYEEAVTEFTKIIDQDPTYKDVLYKRSVAKYALAAYQGVINDILESFRLVGVTSESLLLLGEAQESAGLKAAENTLTTAAIIYPDHRKTRKYRTKTERKERPRWEDSEDTPDNKQDKDLEEKINDILDDLLGEEDDKADNGEDGSKGEDTRSPGQGHETDPPEEDVYVPDNSVNEIYIDEDLTLEIRNGLGNRRVLEQPNILILSETSGDVAVDICVNRNGKVTSAEYNPAISTLSTQSLISLAVRKSNEFWFDGAHRDEVCGTIVFKITGRS